MGAASQFCCGLFHSATSPTPFARHPGNGKQRGALGRFAKTCGSQPSTASAAMSSGSQVDGTPSSQSCPVSPQYFPTSQQMSTSQLEPVLDRRPSERERAGGLSEGGAPRGRFAGHPVNSRSLVLFFLSLFCFFFETF